VLKIGPVQLATKLLLAPIAGYCDLSFRTICREWGGVGLACTDLLSPQGLLRGTATSLDLARTNDFDKPVGMQLYGSDPDIMAEGARWAVEHGATVVDINMGCPVDKVTKKDGGSKLLTDLPRAVAIAARVVKTLEACRAAGYAPVPLTCKMRICWSTTDHLSGQACSPHLARMLADVGVAAVTIHGRTTEDKFQGTVRLEGISRVVDSVAGRIPVIGNGDVREPHDAERMLRETGCSGVMIGRGALSTPWIFRDTWSYLTTGTIPATPTEHEIIENLRRYFELMRAQRDDRYALFQINRRVSWFAKRLGIIGPRDPGDQSGKEPERVSVKPFKEAVRTASSPQAVHAAFDLYQAGGLRGGRITETVSSDEA
jgi:nifR3 family TIM-barrel protein